MCDASQLSALTPSMGGTAADEYYRKQQLLIKQRQQQQAYAPRTTGNFTTVKDLQLGRLAAPATAAAPIMTNSAYQRKPGEKSGFASLRIERGGA